MAALATILLVAIAIVLGRIVFGPPGLRAGFGLWPYLLTVNLATVWITVVRAWRRDARQEAPVETT